MNEPLQALEAFYAKCDQAFPPRVSFMPQALLKRALGALACGLAPFFAAFSIAAVAIAMASAVSDEHPASMPTIFPRALRSAGLSPSDTGQTPPQSQSSVSRPQWPA